MADERLFGVFAKSGIAEALSKAEAEIEQQFNAGKIDVDDYREALLYLDVQRKRYSPATGEQSCVFCGAPVHRDSHQHFWVSGTADPICPPCAAARNPAVAMMREVCVPDVGEDRRPSEERDADAPLGLGEPAA